MKKTAQTFKALSDETRLRILGLLLDGELCVCELMASLDLPQSTVSRHLAYLKNSGLVSDRRRGIWMHYRIVEGDSAFYRELIDLLHKTLAALPQVREDQEKQRRHLLKKASASCCEKAS
ncbi:MAG: ArsR/SmtB family transcription factor [Thermoleophilia bacterium]